MRGGVVMARQVQRRKSNSDSGWVSDKGTGKFYVLLTVQHLDVNLVNDQLNALVSNVFISTCLHVSSSKCSSSGGPTCINTPSGITHSGSKRV